MDVSCHRPFLPSTALEPAVIRTAQASCSESMECFPGISSKFFLKLLLTIPVTPIITGTIVHFRFHTHYYYYYYYYYC